MIVLYNMLLAIGILLGSPFIILIVLLTKKRRKTFLPRLGVKRASSGVQRRGHRNTKEKPIWVHALSVGETRSAVPLVEGLTHRFDNRPILLSVSTRTGFDVAEALFKDLVDELFFFPYDLPLSIKPAVARIAPAAALIVESDIWPNFLFQMKKRRIPVILCNGRLSNRSFSRYRRLPFVSKLLFSSFSGICTPSEWDAQRFIRLGLDPDIVHITGNMKFDQASEAVALEDIEEHRRGLKLVPAHPVLVAGSTHRGEEDVLLDAYRKLTDGFPDLRLIVAPRDPARSGSLERNARSRGFAVSSMTALDETMTPGGWEVMILDTIGALNRIYALADITFIGGSLVNAGGHNPLEPAALSKPILFGPDMSDFQDIAHLLLAAGGAIQVDNSEDINRESHELLLDPVKAREMGDSAFRVFSSNKGAVDRTLNVVENCLH